MISNPTHTTSKFIVPLRAITPGVGDIKRRKRRWLSVVHNELRGAAVRCFRDGPKVPPIQHFEAGLVPPRPASQPYAMMATKLPLSGDSIIAHACHSRYRKQPCVYPGQPKLSYFGPAVRVPLCSDRTLRFFAVLTSASCFRIIQSNPR
jgi:hypothetical protein